MNFNYNKKEKYEDYKIKEFFFYLDNNKKAVGRLL